MRRMGVSFSLSLPIFFEEGTLKGLFEKVSMSPRGGKESSYTFGHCTFLYSLFQTAVTTKRKRRRLRQTKLFFFLRLVEKKEKYLISAPATSGEKK